MKYDQFNEQIIALLGGKDNIDTVVHCMTRLRFKLKDRKAAKTESIKMMDGVIDVVSNDVAYQVIIGTHVSEVYSDLIAKLDKNEELLVNGGKVKKNILRSILDLVSESMTPLLEPIIAAGMLAGLLSLISLMGLVSPESQTYLIFDTIRSSVFYLLPIFMAMSCAKRLNASPYLAVALAGTLVSASINGVPGLSIFGISLPEITYSGSFIPILLAIWFMGHVQQFLKKKVPNVLQYFLVPVLTMVMTLPVTLLFFGPIGSWIGHGIEFTCTILAATLGNWSVVALYAAIQPIIIMFGAGNFIMPIVMAFIAEMGYDPLFLAACTISDIAVGGAMLGYSLRTKDIKQKELFGTVSFSAILGCTEPAIFGVFVKYRRPFVAVMIGGGLGGLFAGLMKVKTYTMAWGLAGLPSYIGINDFQNFYYMVAAVVIGFVTATIAGFILYKPELQIEKVVDEDIYTESNLTDSVIKRELIMAVADGVVIPLAEVKDNAFASGAMGKGIGIKTSGKTLYAPVSGEVVCVFPTKHAIGIKSDYGVEVLIHIGIDTVQLEGRHFTTQIEQGQRIELGQPLVDVDFNAIAAEGYDGTIMMIISNTSQFVEVISTPQKVVSINDACLTIIL